MDKDHIKNRLHDAMHRGKDKATKEELAEVTVVVLTIVGELALEMAAVISELSQRISPPAVALTGTAPSNTKPVPATERPPHNAAGHVLASTSP